MEIALERSPAKTQSPAHILKNIFGYDSFRPLQQDIIESVIQGKDNFVLMPTGGGKSLCYQIPALVRAGTGIVISPLISLMEDQVRALRANGVKAAYYNSSMTSEESRHVLSQLHRGELQLFYIAPERIMSQAFLPRLHEIDIALFAIDEVHCVSQWGHDFRPDYVQLGRLQELFPQVPLIALTATADKQTREDILRQLKLHTSKITVASFDRPNIRYSIVEKHKGLNQLLAFLRNHRDESGIVYCATRKRVEEVCARLNLAGISAKAYHAGLLNKTRKEAQTAFQQDDAQIVVATIAFGMGIDKPNVRFVVHYDIPKNIESYYQETGRAGRDGLPAEALLLYGLGDIVQVKYLIDKSNNEQQKRIELHKLSTMAAFAEAQHCRRKILLNYFGEALEKNCGNCDICLDPPQKYDATRDAQMALSCVYRVEERYGLMHVIDVLRGSENKRVKQLGHDTLSTYGIGKEKSQEEWATLFRQLIHLGYIEQDIANYAILKLTEKAKPLLKGEIKIELAKPRDQFTPNRQIEPSAKKKATTRIETTDLEYDKELFEALRTLRKQIANEEGVPPFIVFSDVSLIEMSAYKPTDDSTFLTINGVGLKKLERYGAEFIDAICQWKNTHS